MTTNHAQDVRNPNILSGIEQLRSRWPQSHAVPSEESEHGAHLIVVPTVELPSFFDSNICTVLFVAPAGFPSARPTNFWTDIEIRMQNKAIPQGTALWSEPRKEWYPTGNFPEGGFEWTSGGSVFSPWDKYWPQWDRVQLWGLRLQAWSPYDSLYTYMMVIKMALERWNWRDKK